MAIPGQSLTIRDPGLSTTPVASSAYCYVGICEKGTANVLYAFTRKSDVVDTLGQGPLSEYVCKALDIAGGPVYAMRITQSAAGAFADTTEDDEATKTAVAGGTGTGTIGVTGTPLDAYNVRIEILTSGSVGAGRFRYTLDAHSLLRSDQYTWSEPITIPSGGAFLIPNTGVTLTFVPGAGGSPSNTTFFQKGDVFVFSTSAPIYTSTQLATAVAALLANSTAFAALVVVGDHATGSAAATIFAALATHVVSFESQFRYIGALMDAGNDNPATTITAFASQSSSRIGVAYGDVAVASSKPFAGWSMPRMSTLIMAASRAADSLISTDLGRYADGSLPGVLAVSHDEFLTTLLDEHKFITTRTWQGVPGFYLTNGRIKSAPGSDFLYWQHRRIMDVACETVIQAQLPFINRSVRTKQGSGAVDERDAINMEESVKSALTDNLLSPANAEGTAGHVSALDYVIDRTNNVLTSSTILSSVAVQPLGYAKILQTSIGFTIL